MSCKAEPRESTKDCLAWLTAPNLSSASSPPPPLPTLHELKSVKLPDASNNVFSGLDSWQGEVEKALFWKEKTSSIPLDGRVKQDSIPGTWGKHVGGGGGEGYIDGIDGVL